MAASARPLELALCAAVLLVSEDLDEVPKLSDRIAVMSEGKVAYLTKAADADRTTIGRYMAGH